MEKVQEYLLANILTDRSYRMTKTTVQAEFSISGDEKLDIVKITEMLNINPSKAAIKGERNLNVKRILSSN